jgi:hypothetical protein
MTRVGSQGSGVGRIASRVALAPGAAYTTTTANVPGFHPGRKSGRVTGATSIILEAPLGPLRKSEKMGRRQWLERGSGESR